jgi:N-ethylmaleimide reductase
MKLFEPAALGPLQLKNKFVMAPMTRSRATGNVPNTLMAQYYAQRATAGLIITEGTSPSPNGLGYARIPGLFTEEQARGWREVTDAVHMKGGKIFVQLMNTGRVSHKANMASTARILAPSPIAAAGEMWTDANGNQPLPVPQEMTTQDIDQAIAEYTHSAKLAATLAGFDGVEIHGANGYLIDQFLNPRSNVRKDIYGTNRMEFALKIAKSVAQAIGPEKTGFRISPYGTFNDLEAFDGTDEFYAELASKLSRLGLVYIHVIDHGKGDVKRLVREFFKQTYILSQGYDVERAEADLAEGKGDLVAFGKVFIGNPDYVERSKAKIPLDNFDATKLYTPGPEGYVDYPNRAT